MILRGRELTTAVQETADICIIGSGCGGGACAKVLAQAGKRVIILEEGGYYTAKDFDSTEQTAYTNLYQQRAGLATDDLGVTVLQGRCVGGSSTVNWMTTLRTPEFVLEEWKSTLGIPGLSAPELEPYFARIEQYLHVHPEPDERHSPNNRIILDGAKALGYRTHTNGRNARDCIRAGACGLGCPYDAKMSVALTYIPDAVAAGATLYADVRAERIAVTSGRKRVTGTILRAGNSGQPLPFSIEAPIVVVAGSAINSPVLLLKSGLANSSDQLGRNLTFHLTSAVLGLFDREIYPAGGIPQSAICPEFLNKNGDGSGFWIEAVPVYPALAGLALPGFGSAHRDLMQRFRNIGASIVLVKDRDSVGRVTVNAQGRAAISYTPGPQDLSYMKEGLGVAANIHFAAGARTVMTLHASRTAFSAPEEIEPRLAAAEWGINRLGLFSAHPLGTCRMGSDPGRSVVDPHCQAHDVPGLFVIDGSVMPTSLGVNPQLTILAVAEKNAEWIAENFRTVAG
jgi:choline dehydrogenase-like flavoprotein